MDIRLSLLESFVADGSDGNRYKVRAYDRLALVPGTAQQWESTGLLEYRLEDHRPIHVAPDGTMSLAGSGIRLTPSQADSVALASQP